MPSHSRKKIENLSEAFGEKLKFFGIGNSPVYVTSFRENITYFLSKIYVEFYDAHMTYVLV